MAGFGGNITALAFTYNSQQQRVIEAVEGGALHEIYTDASGNWIDNPIAGTAGNARAVSFSLR